MQKSTTGGRTVRPVVTIFEQYGAGAAQLGEQVAQALGLPFHPQAFSSELLDQDQDADLQQRAVLIAVHAAMGGAYRGFEGRDVVTTQQQKYDLVMENNATVWRQADQGGVIVGRNGAVILADRPATLHLLLTGPVEDRIARAAQEAGITLERAVRRQRREDELRAEMSKVLYGWDPRQPDRYDMVLNTSRIPLDGAVDAVVRVAQALAR